MLYDTKELTKEAYKKECARLLIAFENSTYKQENTIHIAKNVTIGYGLDLLKCDGAPKNFLLDYLPDDSKKLKIGNEEFTFYEIIEKYRANQQGFTDHNVVKNYLQNKVFDFSLTQEQAQKILENMIPIYEKRLSPIETHYLPYSKERASLLSMRYLGKAIENNGLIKAIKADSRFLAWFIIRYKTNINTYFGYIARSCDEADIYLSNPNINKYALIFDIFSHLNIIKHTIKYRIYKDKDNIKNYVEKNKEGVLLNLAQWYENDLDFIKFNTKNQVIKISKSNISSIRSNLTKNFINDIITTLSPHLNYINQTFAKGSVSTFDLANIYVLNEIKDCEKLNVALYQRSQNNTNDNNTAKNTSNQSAQNIPNDNVTPSQQSQENILIICLSPKTQPQNTDTYEIKQQNNTFLTIVVFEGTKVDFDSLDSKNSEILLARITTQSNTNKESIEVFQLQGSTQAMKQQNNTLTTKGLHSETYIFEAKTKADSKENSISPILKVYANKEASPNKYIEIHNFAKHTLKSNHTLESSESNSTQNQNNNAQSPQDDISYLLSNDSTQRYCDIKLFVDSKPHDTNCANEGNFKIVVKNTDYYGLKENDILYLYNCENRKQLYATIQKDFSAFFAITLDLPKQDECSIRTLSSHIILSTQVMQTDETIKEYFIKTNPNFQINKKAKCSGEYVIEDAKLKTTAQKSQMPKKQILQKTESNEILSIRFNGKELQILENGKATQELTFKAQSGDNKDKDSMIESGIYYIKANKPESSNMFDFIWTNSWNLGKQYIKLYENKDNENPKNNPSWYEPTTTAYTIHGGKSYGDNKGIDLANEDSSFFEALQNLTNKYKAELANAGNVIRVEVRYESQMVLEVVRKWEYKTKQANGSYIYDSAKPTVSEFVLKKDDKQILNGYILEPEGPDTTESNKNKRIPVGEYNIKWHKSPLTQNKNKELTARRLDIPNQQINDEFSHIRKMLDQMTKCNNANCRHKDIAHSHIVPLLYNDKVSISRGILIHLGSKRENSRGCLLPGFKLNNKEKPTEFLAGSTTNATAELLARIMEHNLDSYNKLATIPHFKVIISNDYS